LPIKLLASCEQGAVEAPSKYKGLQVDLTLPPEDKYLAQVRQYSLNDSLEKLSRQKMKQLMESGKKYEKTPDRRATDFFRFEEAEKFCKQYKIDIDSIDVFELLDTARKARKIVDEFTNALNKKIVSNESLSPEEYDKMMEVFTNVCMHNRYQRYKIFDLRLIEEKITLLAKRI